MITQNKTIAVLDSGVGGLSIFETISKSLPELSIVYACDNKNFPYGTKSQEKVLQCISELAKNVISQFSPSLLVIACNTASTIALDSLRKTISIPIVGVVPAIKPAASISKTRVIGLLATPGTVQRPYTDQLVKDHAAHCLVIKVGSTKLVEMAEDKLRGISCNLETLRAELSPFFPEGKHSPIDTIVLGCTHFPLLLEELKNVIPKKVTWLDSSQAIAQRVATLVSPHTSCSKILTAVFTEMNNEARALIPYLTQLGFSEFTEITKVSEI
ncbi:MAG: glutamate racemase [Deltaproteobacteria bacterium]|nr:glutamate racemase [Deltaproteobacteria bacterium]